MTGAAARVDAGAAVGAAGRAEALAARFREIAVTRMDGVPILHPRLAVAAVGFEVPPGGDAAVGVLVTPWFMNLVRLPVTTSADADADADTTTTSAPHGGAPRLAVGAKAVRRIGAHAFEFIGAHEEGLGPFEACSLFSPMFEFEDQAAALATAQAVLDALRQVPADRHEAAPESSEASAGVARDTPCGAPPATAPVPAATCPPAPSRRALLFGRGGSPAR